MLVKCLILCLLCFVDGRERTKSYLSHVQESRKRDIREPLHKYLTSNLTLSLLNNDKMKDHNVFPFKQNHIKVKEYKKFRKNKMKKPKKNYIAIDLPGIINNLNKDNANKKPPKNKPEAPMKRPKLHQHQTVILNVNYDDVNKTVQENLPENHITDDPTNWRDDGCVTCIKNSQSGI